MALRTDILGSTGLQRFGDDVYDEWLRQLKGTKGRKTYREMRDNDPTIGSAITIITSLIRQVKWTVEAADEDNPQALEEKEFLEGCLDDMSHTWEDFMGEVLSMIWFGYSYFEKVYKIRDGKSADPRRRSKFEDGRMGWRGFFIRSQETNDGWDFDEDGGIQGMYQCAPPDYYRVFLPIEKCLLFRTELNRNNPEGRSMLRNAYRPYYFKKRLEEIEAIGISKDMVGTPVAYVPVEYLDSNAKPAQKEVVKAITKGLGRFQRNEQEVVIFPAPTTASGASSGFAFELASTGGRRQIDIDASIKRYSKDIAMVLMTQFIFMGMDKAGSFALSSTMTNLLSIGLGAMLDIIEDVINRFAVQELFELNGVPQELRPRLVHGDMEKEDFELFSKILLTLVNAGAITPDETLEDWLRARMELPEKDIPDEDADVFGAPRSPPIDEGDEDPDTEEVADEGSDIEDETGV